MSDSLKQRWQEKSRRLKARWTETMAEYGMVALGVWFAIFFTVMGGFTIAISNGIEIDGAIGNAGILGGAYAATQLTKPLRLMATLALTPVVARFLRRSDGDKEVPPDDGSPPSARSEVAEPETTAGSP